jgi:hypothetical protein
MVNWIISLPWYFEVPLWIYIGVAALFFIAGLSSTSYSNRWAENFMSMFLYLALKAILWLPIMVVAHLFGRFLLELDI